MFSISKNRPMSRFAKTALVVVISILLMIPVVSAYANGPDDNRLNKTPYSLIPATDDELAQMKALEEAYYSGAKTYADTYFNFYLKCSPGDYVFALTDVSTKENDSSFYICVQNMEVPFCGLAPLGAKSLNSTWYWLVYNPNAWLSYDVWINDAWINSYAEYQIYNSVWETLGGPNVDFVYARIDVIYTNYIFNPPWWGNAQFKGCYSPDCWLYWNYPILNP